METYHGTCHCGAVSFTFTSEAITAGYRCNCSVCIRKGAVMSREYLPFDNLSGKDNLTVYQFGDRDVNHYFCRHCGIYPFHEICRKPDFYRVNLGCVAGIAPLSLDVELIDGRSF